MRAIAVLVAVMAGGAAAGADFGVSYDAAHQSLTTGLSSPLVFEECEKRICAYTHPSHEIEISLVLGDKDVIDGFGITYQADSWAAASAYAREIQKAFHVPERDIVSADDIARRGIDGTKGEAQTATAICFASHVDARPYLYCRRKWQPKPKS